MSLEAHFSAAACSLSLRRRITWVLTVVAAAVERCQAPPAIFFPVDLHFQMPTAWRLTHSLPLKGLTYLACWVISNFLMIFSAMHRNECRTFRRFP